MADIGQIGQHKKAGRRGAAILTPAVIDLFVASIAAGVSTTDAAKALGVGRSTVYDWIARGRKRPASIYGAFVGRVEAAEALAAAQMVQIIRGAAFESWQAAAWWLERRFPDEWGRKDRTDDELRRLIEAGARERGFSEDDVRSALREASAILKQGARRA